MRLEEYSRLIELIAKFTVSSLQVCCLSLTYLSSWLGMLLIFSRLYINVLHVPESSCISPPDFYLNLLSISLSLPLSLPLSLSLSLPLSLSPSLSPSLPLPLSLSPSPSLSLSPSLPLSLSLPVSLSLSPWGVQSWQFSANSIHYLLGFWQRLVGSVPYIRSTEPHLLDTYMPEVQPHTHDTIDCTRKWIGNVAYIVSLAILRTVTARGKLAGVTNDKESVLL